MNIYSRNRGRKCSAVMWLLTVALGLGVGASDGQSPAMVKGQVSLPSGELRLTKGLRVRAIPKSPDARSQTRELTKGDYNYTTHVYNYTIERLQPGKYYFVLCDGLDYKPDLQTGTVQAGKDLTVDFLLEDQPKGDGKIANVLLAAEGRPAEKGAFVFLHDFATGCRVKEVNTDDKGKYEFDGLPLPTTRYRESINEDDEPVIGGAGR